MAIFKDIDASFRKLSNGGIGEKEGNAAIIQFIQDVLLTQEGEALFQPSYFTDITDYLQGTANILSSLTLKRQIYDALSNNLKHIIIEEDGIEITPDPENNQYDIMISYKESEIEKEKEIEFTFKLDR